MEVVAGTGTCAPAIEVVDRSVQRSFIGGMVMWRLGRWPVATPRDRLALLMVFDRLDPSDQLNARKALARHFAREAEA